MGCGCLVAKTNKRCKACHAVYIENFPQPLPRLCMARMRETALARHAAIRGREITRDDVEAMRGRKRAGESLMAIARDYGLSTASVSILIRFGSWAAYRGREVAS